MTIVKNIVDMMKPKIAFKGVRISWDILERKVFLAMLANLALSNASSNYDKERKLITQEYLRRLEVIEGLSVNYESILYADFLFGGISYKYIKNIS